jgi:hypothetical protein
VPTYKVKYKGEIHNIDWTDSRKPTKDELRLAISNKILQKEAPPKLDTRYKPAPPPSPEGFTSSEEQEPERILPGSFVEATRQRLNTQELPEPEPTTFMRGFGRSLKRDILGTTLPALESAAQPQTLADFSGLLLPGAVPSLQRAFPGAKRALSKLPELPEPVATPLELPGTPQNFADAPIPRGASTYGITPKRSNDPMLSHIPERLQPTSPTQQHFENMLPSTMRERIKGAEALGEDFVPSSTSSNIPESTGIPRNEMRGSTLGELPAQSAADMGLPNLPEPNSLKIPGTYEPPSNFTNTMNLMKSAKTTGDLSAPLRQGLPRIHTKEYWGAIKPMFKSLMSEEGYQSVVQELQNKPSLPVARHAGLAVFEREEQVASNLAEKIPWLGKYARASNRAYDAFIKKLRMDTFENLLKDATNSGMPVDPKFTQNLAEVINTATGRGTLGKLEKNADLLNNIFFSPKFISSRVQMFNPQYYMKLDPISRKEAIKSTMSLITFGSGIASLAHLAGAGVETDSTSSDFGKIKLGDYRIDPYAGMQQYVVFMSKIAQQQQKSPITGNVREFDAKYGSPTGLGVLGRFGQNKLNPVLGLGAKLLEGTDYAGQPLNIKMEVLKSFIPMLAEDTAEVLAEDPTMLPLMIPSGFGMGVQRFTPRESKNERPSRPGRKSRKGRE